MDFSLLERGGRNIELLTLSCCFVDLDLKLERMLSGVKKNGIPNQINVHQDELELPRLVFSKTKVLLK